MRRWLVTAALAAAPLVLGAAGAPPSSDLPDLSAVRALVYAGDYTKAVQRLTVARRVRSASEWANAG